MYNKGWICTQDGQFGFKDGKAFLKNYHFKWIPFQGANLEPLIVINGGENEISINRA